MRIACTCIQKKVEPDYLPADLQNAEGKKVLSDNLKTCISENKDNMMGVQGAWAKVVKTGFFYNLVATKTQKPRAMRPFYLDTLIPGEFS